MAEFVARNGPEFESITKAKQQGNPKFGFLFGGDYYQYYQWRVNSEQTSKQSPPKSEYISLYIYIAIIYWNTIYKLNIHIACA